MKALRLVSAAVFVLLAILCFWGAVAGPNMLFLVVGLICLAFAGFSLYKVFGRSAGPSKSNDFEL